MQLEDIYDFFMQKLTHLILTDELTDGAKMKAQLRSIARDAELMHCYIGFQEENEKMEAQGLPKRKVEDEFSGIDVDWIHFFMVHDDLL